MRVLSGAEIKRAGRRGEIKREGGQGGYKPYPRVGTKVRQVYDMFAANKGRIISINLEGYPHRSIYDLVDYYGCDIRKIKNKRWLFAGEWFGKDYVSYFEPRDGNVQKGETPIKSSSYHYDEKTEEQRPQ